MPKSFQTFQEHVQVLAEKRLDYLLKVTFISDGTFRKSVKLLSKPKLDVEPN